MPEGYGHQHNFELFGVDFLVDSEGWPWLLEVQMGPELHTEDPATYATYPRVLQETFEMGLSGQALPSTVRVVWEA